jgi:MFS transporter, DHA1 family, inner membrane transport protein
MSRDDRTKLPLGLLALAMGGFGIGLTEFGIVGLLPQIASSLHVTDSTAGFLVSGYALSVAVGALVLTAAVARLERKTVLLGLMALFILGNLVCAVAPTYGVLLSGRIIAALCHGAFFGVGAVVAGDLVAANKKGRAIALMFGGLTVATVIGVPLGALLGQQLGWRAIFWALTIIGILVLTGIQLMVPRVSAAARSNLRRELTIFARPQVWLSIAVSALTFGGVIGAYTYIAFTLTKVSAFPDSAIPWLLAVFGVGTLLGNFVGGRYADRALNPTLIVLLIVVSIVLVVFAAAAASQIVTVVAMFLLGFTGLATAPGLQLRLTNYTSDAPTMGSGTNIAALNIGNAVGAWIGGLTLADGLGYTAPLDSGAILTVIALAALIASIAIDRRHRTVRLPLIDNVSPSVPRP